MITIHIVGPFALGEGLTSGLCAWALRFDQGKDFMKFRIKFVDEKNVLKFHEFCRHVFECSFHMKFTAVLGTQFK